MCHLHERQTLNIKAGNLLKGTERSVAELEYRAAEHQEAVLSKRCAHLPSSSGCVQEGDTHMAPGGLLLTADLPVRADALGHTLSTFNILSKTSDLSE